MRVELTLEVMKAVILEEKAQAMERVVVRLENEVAVELLVVAMGVGVKASVKAEVTAKVEKMEVATVAKAVEEVKEVAATVLVEAEGKEER